jgi:hypothetical protein
MKEVLVRRRIGYKCRDALDPKVSAADNALMSINNSIPARLKFLDADRYFNAKLANAILERFMFEVGFRIKLKAIFLKGVILNY